MWQLYVTDSNRQWTPGGTFDTVTAATAQIIALEGLTISGLHLETFVETKFGTDDEAFAAFEYTGRRALYVIKRMVQ